MFREAATGRSSRTTSHPLLPHLARPPPCHGSLATHSHALRQAHTQRTPGDVRLYSSLCRRSRVVARKPRSCGAPPRRARQARYVSSPCSVRTRLMVSDTSPSRKSAPSPGRCPPSANVWEGEGKSSSTWRTACGCSSVRVKGSGCSSVRERRAAHAVLWWQGERAGGKLKTAARWPPCAVQTYIQGASVDMTRCAAVHMQGAVVGGSAAAAAQPGQRQGASFAHGCVHVHGEKREWVAGG